MGTPLIFSGSHVVHTGFETMNHQSKNILEDVNESLIGLRHNHDISMILTRRKGLALMHYICSYATKLNAPIWKRLAVAADLLDLSRQQ